MVRLPNYRPALIWSFLLSGQLSVAIPTWPASSDELEDIMFLNTGYRARNFSAAVTPCGFSANGPGRSAAAEWIRTAFHDMSTGSVFTGVGGLDASLMYELNTGENIGDAFATTFTTFAPFLTSRSSLSDVIAMGVYTAVRACGGPIIPIRPGRIDATSSGPIGVPQPQNSVGTLINQFLRVGFNTSEMIAVTACGHTLGGVHAANFPQIVTTGTYPNDFAPFDSTSGGSSSKFDVKIASEYASEMTTDPLVVGPSVASTRNSDGKVFGADKNVTIASMADPATFTSVCQTVLQKMIEVVPKSVTLSDPIDPYEVKPYELQLTLQDEDTILFAGDIRVRTTSRSVSSVELSYKDRTRAESSATISTTLSGTAAGFDENFSFYGFSTQIPTSTSISSFIVQMTLSDGTIQTFNNNGAEFPVQDNIMLQGPQSCISPTADADGNKTITVVAAVRSTETATPTLGLTLRVPRTLPSNLPVPSLQSVSVTMSLLSSVGDYNLFSASYLTTASQAESVKFDVTVDTSSDSFKDATNLGDTCSTFGSSPLTSSSSVTTTLSSLPSSSVTASTAISTAHPTSTAFSLVGCFTDSVDQRALAGAASVSTALTIEKCASSCTFFQFFGVEFGTECYCGDAQDPSSVAAPASDCSMACGGSSGEICGGDDRLSLYENILFIPITEPPVPGYDYQGCYTDDVQDRVLANSFTTSDNMTIELCASFCQNSTFFGVEFTHECYCGDILSPTSTRAPESDCNFICGGSTTEICGAADRLSLYAQQGGFNTLPDWSYQGCTSDDVEARVLTAATTTSDTNMTHEVCASFCQGYIFMGLEFGSQCYCGNDLSNPTTAALESDCNSTCTGENVQICGGANRLNLFKSEEPPPGNPTIDGWTFEGCFTDSPEERSLVGQVLEDSNMSVEGCAAFCANFSFFGTEFGTECYCGNELAETGTIANATDCSTVCPGNKTELCGAGNRLSLYAAT